MPNAYTKCYGILYQGSKNTIAEWVVNRLPAGECLVDLFAGGCAITHCALESGKWKRIIANDITDTPRLFLDAIRGKYRDCDRWVSREEFELFKATDPFVRVIWSFGGNGTGYLYSRKIEEYKRRVHRLFFSKTIEERRLAFRQAMRELNNIAPFARPSFGNMTDDEIASWRAKYAAYRPEMRSLQSLQCLQSLESLQRLQSLQSLESLQSLQSLQNLEVLQGDYRALDIPANAVIYCDPPYAGTTGYNGEAFDHAAFYNWCREQTAPLFVSEYNMPEDFTLVDTIEKPKLFSSNGTSAEKTLEKLYCRNFTPPPRRVQPLLNFG